MENEFSRLVDALPGLVWTALPDGQADYVNRQWCDYTGMSLDEAIGPGWLSAVHPDDFEHVLAQWGSFLATGKAGDIEARLRRADGVYRLFNFSASPIADAAGGVAGWCGITTDIEDRKRAEALLASERDLKTIINTLPTTAWSTDAQGYVEFLSNRWLDYAGFTAEQGAGLGWGQAIHPDDQGALFSYWQSCLETGTPVDTEARMRRFDGEYRWFLFRANPLRDENGAIVKWYGTNIDIEDRKRADMQLAAEKQLLEMIASGRALRDVLGSLCGFVEELAPDCLCGVYPIDWAGPTFQYGVAPSLPASYVDPIAGWPVREDIAPCGIAAFEKRQVIVADVETDPIWRGTEYRNHVVEHGLRSVWSTPICSLDGRILGTFCVYQRKPGTPSPREQELISHVTHIASIALERALAETELRRVNRYLEEGQRLTRTGTVNADIVADDHQWSEEAYRIFEFDLSEKLTFARVRERLYPDDVPSVMGVIEGTPQGGTFDFECRLQMPAGEVKHIHVVGRRIDEQPGQRVLLACMQDITGRTLAENELRRINGHLTDAHRLAKTGSVSFDYVTDTHLWSDETYRILEIELGSKVTGTTVASLVHPDDMPIFVAFQQESVGPQQLTFRVVMADGRVKWLNAVAEVTKRTDGVPAGTVSIQDVTELRNAAEALEEVRSELAHVARVSSLGMLTASIAHEVNQPLSGIITNASTGLRMLAADPPNIEGARETVKRTIRDGNRAAEVIARLRALFARKSLAAEVVDLNEALQEVIALSAGELQRNRVVLKSELADGLPAVIGDRVQLQQVILNLMLNAADALAEVSDRPRQLTLRTTAEDEDRIRLTASDNGTGFGGQNPEQFFDAFHTTKSGGMGIGLSVSRSIIESHGGRLWAQANDGPGATFSFSIPRGSGAATTINDPDGVRAEPGPGPVLRKRDAE